MMEQLPEKKIAMDMNADQIPGDKPMPSVGCQLREGRERMGMSVEDVVESVVSETGTLRQVMPCSCVNVILMRVKLNY